MKQKGPIIIKENGKKLKTYPNFHQKSDDMESAATLEPSKKESVPEFVRYSNTKPEKTNQLRPFKIFQPILIAIVSAIIVGIVLSFVMFQVFVNVEEDLANQSQQLPGISEAKTATNETNTSKSVYTLEPIELFVLQAGVFSEKENADMLAAELLEMEIPSFIWERDGQFFVFTGAANSKSEGEEIAEQYKDVELFVKEWSTLPQEMELTEEEYTWITQYQETIFGVLNSYEEGEASEAFETLPDVGESELLKSVKEKTDGNLQSETDANFVFLLEIMADFEKIYTG